MAPLPVSFPPWTWWVLSLTLLLGVASIVAGCSGSRFTEVQVPERPPSVNLEAPDTIGYGEVPPLRLDGETTRPGTTVVYRDRPSGPLLRAREFVVDRTPPGQSVSVQYVTGGRTTEQRYRWPVYGETLTIYPEAREAAVSGTERPDRNRPEAEAPDTTVVRDTVATGRVSGEPEKRTVRADCPPCPEGWYGLQNEFAIFGAFVCGLVVFGVVAGLIGGLIPIP